MSWSISRARLGDERFESDAGVKSFGCTRRNPRASFACHSAGCTPAGEQRPFLLLGAEDGMMATDSRSSSRGSAPPDGFATQPTTFPRQPCWWKMFQKALVLRRRACSRAARRGSHRAAARKSRGCRACRGVCRWRCWSRASAEAPAGAWPDCRKPRQRSTAAGAAFCRRPAAAGSCANPRSPSR